MPISDKIFELRIATRRCDINSVINLKTKLLFLLRNSALSPSELMTSLVLAKTNLALLAGDLAKQGLIRKEKRSQDKREIVYVITDEGKEYLNSKLEAIEQSVQKALPSHDEYIDAEINLANAVSIFEFIN